MYAFCNSKNKRIFAVIATISLLMVVMLSSFFIIEHIDHKCNEEDCIICSFLHQCENTLHGLDSETVTGYVIISLVLVLSVSFIQQDVSILWDTPVSRKVRLND